LPYRYDGKVTLQENAKPLVTVGNIKLLSGCTDSQTSADAELNGRWSGAMTRAFLYAMDVYKDAPTAGQLLTCMDDYLTRSGYEQRPQLSCSELLNTDTPFQSGGVMRGLGLTGESSVI